MKKLKRAFAVLLSASLVMSQLSATAFAEEVVRTFSDNEDAYELVLDCDVKQELSCKEVVHVHEDTCYELILASDSTASELEETETLKCSLTEHEHNDSCYVMHEHNENCYQKVEKEKVTSQIQIEGKTPALTGIDEDNDDPWTYYTDSNAYYLDEDAEISEGMVVADGATIYVNGDCVIDGGDEDAIECAGELTIEGAGNLTLKGNNGIVAASVAIDGVDVDFEADSCGIQIYSKEGDATVSLTNVNGSIEGGYAGIYVNGECADSRASVSIDKCDLEVTSTAASYNKRACKSGITVYVSKAEEVESSITIKDSKVTAIGADAGLSINNYLGDADATNSACSTITIDNSTVVAEGTNGTWAGIFASVLGQHEDADSMIIITDSSVYAVSPNTGILTSSQKGESKIVLDNSILGASGKTALSMIEATCQKQVAELKNGSTYVQMTPDAVMNGEIDVFDGKTIVATAGDGITYDKSENYFVIPQGSAVAETFTDGTVNGYTFNKQTGGIGGSGYGKEEIWGYDEDDAIIITTPEELIEFATRTQDDTDLGNCEGLKVKLGANIDMSGYDWYYRNAEGTIVTDHRIPEFSGIFDGQGYTISNMSYKDEYAEATDAVPLAFILTANGTHKDFTIDGITVETVAPARFGGFADALAYSGDGYTEAIKVENIDIDADAQLAFGGFAFKILDVAKVEDCHVNGLIVDANGVLDGPNGGRCGGFFATGGEVTPFEDCSVSDFVLNASSTGTYIGGFVGGASMTASYENCDVEGFELNAEGKMSAVGGFAGYTAGSAWGAGLSFENCDVTNLDIETTNKISVGAGGFIGNLYGQGKSIADGAHHFTNCTTQGSISGDAYAGGFAGWLYGREKGCAAEFVDCSAAVNIFANDYYAAGFVGNFTPKGANKMIVQYTNCTASGDVFAAEPVGSFLDADATSIDGIIGGTYNYDPENIDSETGETNNVASGYRALNNGDGTWTVFPDNSKEVVEIAFHRWNDEADAYENWRTVEVYKSVAFVDEDYDNALNYSHPDYRFAAGLKELNDEVSSDERPMTYWTNAEDGFGSEVLTNTTIIEDDMNVYVAYDPTPKVCRIVETGVEYTTLSGAVADANAMEGANTIEMLKDIDFDSASALSVTGDLTIIGAGRTISRGNYTGTLFTVPAGSSLTLDGGITFDGSNNWIFEKELYENDLYNRVDNPISAYAYSVEGGTVGNAAAFVVNGTVTAKDATIKNFFSIKDSNAGDAAIFKVNADADLITDGVLIDHVATYGANTVTHLAKNSEWYIQGDTVISNSFGGRNGGICRNDYGQIYMSGGTIKNNAGKNVNGSVFMMYGQGSAFYMTGGTICGNSSVFGQNNGRCAAVYLHSNSYMKMTGGTICHNIGGSRGGIDSYQTNAILDINRVDQEFDNAEWKENGAAAYTASNHPYVVDNVSLLEYPTNDVGNTYIVDKWWVTGGIYTQDVDEFCAEGYVCIPYDDSERTDDYIVVPGYRVKYYSVETEVTTDETTGEDAVAYNTTLEEKYFHLLPRDKFWYEMDERADKLQVFHDESNQLINTWYTEKEMENVYDFTNSKLDSDLDLYGTWVKYITVTFDDQSMTEGNAVPELKYSIDYGELSDKLVNVIVNVNSIENPVAGDHEITGTVTLTDGMDKAENYAVVVVPGTLTVTEPETTQPSEPAPTDPTQPSEPAPTDPTQPSEPAPTDPTQPSEPAPTDPTQPSEPVPSDPAPTEPDNNEPEYTRPRPSQNITTVVIDDSDVPLAAAPEKSEDIPTGVLGAFEIIDNMIPLAALPATGSSTAFWLMLSALSALGLAGTTMIERKKRK